MMLQETQFSQDFSPRARTHPSVPSERTSAPVGHGFARASKLFTNVLRTREDSDWDFARARVVAATGERRTRDEPAG